MTESDRGIEGSDSYPLPVPTERGSQRFLNKKILNTAIQATTIITLIYTGAYIGDQFDLGLLGLYGGLFTAIGAKTFVLDRLLPINQNKITP